MPPLFLSIVSSQLFKSAFSTQTRTVAYLAESSRAAQERFEQQQRIYREEITARAAAKVVSAFRHAKSKGKEREMDGYNPFLPSSFPPVLSRLLSAKLYRLATFHLLSNPSLLSDMQLVNAMVQHLEYQGAARLAKRLHMAAEKAVTSGQVRLWSEPKKRLFTEGNMSPPSLSTEKTVQTVSRFSDSALQLQSRTKYYNNLLYQLLPHTLKSPAVSKIPSARSLILSHVYKDVLKSRHDWNIPVAALDFLQTEKLLDLIAMLEDQGFQPDEVTATLILRSWLRCALSRHHYSAPTGCPVQSDGNSLPCLKDNGSEEYVSVPSKPLLSLQDVMILFQTVSLHLSTLSIPSGFKGRKEGEYQWDMLVRPVGKSFIRALRSFSPAIPKPYLTTVPVTDEAFSLKTQYQKWNYKTRKIRHRKVQRCVGVIKHWMRERKKVLMEGSSQS
ncbi:hypothetical protein L204_102255 [Cryptococcus depauperatus]